MVQYIQLITWYNTYIQNITERKQMPTRNKREMEIKYTLPPLTCNSVAGTVTLTTDLLNVRKKHPTSYSLLPQESFPFTWVLDLLDQKRGWYIALA